MQVIRLAKYLEIKYNLKSIAISPIKEVDQVREDLKNFYTTWLVGPRVKDQSILHWSKQGTGEEFDQINNLVKIVHELSQNKEFSESKLYRKLKQALGLSQLLKDKTLNLIRDEIILNTIGLRESNKNEINKQESKIRTFLRMLDSVYEKSKNIIGKYVPITLKNKIDSEEAFGGYEDQKRKPLSKEKLLMFSNTLAAQTYGFNSLEMLEKLLDEPGARDKLTTLINAIDRGHIPKDGPEIMSITKSIREYIDSLSTNKDIFEGEEDIKAILPPEEDWSQKMQKLKHEKSLIKQEEEMAELERQKLMPLVKKRDEEYLQKQIEEDRARHIRSEGSKLLKDFIKKRAF